jgi:hypothetical protein
VLSIVRRWPVKISHFRELAGTHPRATFSVELDNGLVIRGVALHQDESRWFIRWPGADWTDQAGQRRFQRVVVFTADAVANKFEREILKALAAGGFLS